MQQLGTVLARIASALDVQPPDVIVLDRRFNASWAVDGWHARRGRLIGSSLASLSSAVDLLKSHQTPLRWRRLTLASYFSNALLSLCSQPVRGLLAVQAHLIYRDSQRAEFLADELAASVAGTDAVIGLHDAFLAQPAVETTIRRASITGKRGGTELLDDIRSSTSATTPRPQHDRPATRGPSD
jgi:hypothetical protein